MTIALNIRNSFELETQGNTLTGKQGLAADPVTDEMVIGVEGVVLHSTGTIATATVKEIWDSATDLPDDYDYLFVWVDQDCYLQLIGTTGNVIVPLVAYVPQTFSLALMLCAEDTDAIVGGTEPTLEAMTKINIGNYSGEPVNFVVAAIK